MKKEEVETKILKLSKAFIKKNKDKLKSWKIEIENSTQFIENFYLKKNKNFYAEIEFFVSDKEEKIKSWELNIYSKLKKEEDFKILKNSTKEIENIYAEFCVYLKRVILLRNKLSYRIKLR